MINVLPLSPPLKSFITLFLICGAVSDCPKLARRAQGQGEGLEKCENKLRGTFVKKFPSNSIQNIYCSFLMCGAVCAYPKLAAMPLEAEPSPRESWRRVGSAAHAPAINIFALDSEIALILLDKRCAI